jgi:hypothetical protein
MSTAPIVGEWLAAARLEVLCYSLTGACIRYFGAVVAFNQTKRI